MIEIEITVIDGTTQVPHPGTDYRLIEAGEVGKDGDEFFNYKTGAWVADPNAGKDTTPYDPTKHAVYRRKRLVWRPFKTVDEVPIGAIIRSKHGKLRAMIISAQHDQSCSHYINIEFGAGGRCSAAYLFGHSTFDNGDPIGICEEQ